jgi:hypothetical protein
VGSGSDTKGRNFLLLARNTRETLSARAALHAGTWTEMARKEWSFWLSKRLHCPKSIPLSALDQKQGYAVHDPMSAKRQSGRSLFDHIVGACEHRWRYFEAKCFGRREIDHEFELGRLFDWYVGGLGPAQYLVDKIC